MKIIEFHIGFRMITGDPQPSAPKLPPERDRANERLIWLIKWSVAVMGAIAVILLLNIVIRDAVSMLFG